MTSNDPTVGTWVPVGRVVGVFGLRGGLKVEPLSDDARFFELENELILHGVPRAITRVHVHKTQFRIHLEGITKPEQAELLRGETLFVDRASLRELEEDEFWATEIVGMDVFDEVRGPVGRVESIISGPAQDLLEVNGVLIPWVKEFVVEVKPQEKQIVVRLIPGMFPGESEEEEHVR